MHFSLSAASAALALAVSAAAQANINPDPNFDPVTSPKKNTDVVAGQPFEITWTVKPDYKDVTVKIELIGGQEQNGQTHREDIAASVPNSAEKLTWPVPMHPPMPFYGLKIVDVNNASRVQYSEPFHIVGGSASSSAASPASPASPATSTASGVSYGTPAVTSASAPAVPTGVSPPGNAPVGCGSGISNGINNGSAPVTPSTGSNGATPGSNGGYPSSGGAPPAGGATGSKNAANPNGAPVYPGAGGASTGPSGGASGNPNNSTIPVTAAAPPVAQVGLLGVLGAVAAAAFSL